MATTEPIMDSIANVGVYQNMVNLLICPLTGKLFLNPVIAEDGIVYERDKILVHILENKKSPKTGKEIGLNFKNVYPIKSLLNDFVEKYPHLLKFQYVPDSEDDKIKKLYCISSIQIHKYIDIGNYDLLLSFTGFDLKSISWDRFKDIIKNAKNNVQKHVLDNCIEINTILNDGHYKWNIINYMCMNANVEMVKYIIDMEGVDLEHPCDDGWRPIHQVSYHQKTHSELIKYLISKDVDLFCKNDDGYTSLEYFCKNNDCSVIKFAVDKVQNIAKELVDKMCNRLEKRESISDDHKEELKQLINSKVI